MQFFTLRQTTHTTAGCAFYDSTGQEWQALELFNRDTKQIVKLPFTDEVNENPNIGITRFNGLRTIDGETYSQFLKRYNI